MNEQENDTIYLVVVNHEEQYSIWPKWKKQIPTGWKSVGKEGLKEECLTYIEDVWKDMRPLSLRKAMMENDKTAFNN
ncbi:MbtH family NRPS accessory protein [Aetokthonos hydrillicola Thurmond2011]|jgi:MbtH protein|uniref:MbtH family NRPS accessory protein n=1 Tax=Aetokthonos hydrillicola Thurmond2011 TaxID=2712845 RepID=A0AAP5IB38_9CYAN|nr:MbtH family NRPS accessory protein [Aetokthonos hydrillicola]MBO3458671.1 MbtH family NRPS accessory protein [Aetokthonos hydrillicola CCALA 1050]MBW4588024.1 MbtH family NRPS accessory protein [Aetokthonos hydrillicola CCALA 1050]MDR9897024.1 MbtH family NRPS accessory protein [Aetokthonos hydrillicola Thurmond2011]